jgi:hypothetical protein
MTLTFVHGHAYEMSCITSGLHCMLELYHFIATLQLTNVCLGYFFGHMFLMYISFKKIHYRAIIYCICV